MAEGDIERSGSGRGWERVGSLLGELYGAERGAEVLSLIREAADRGHAREPRIGPGEPPGGLTERDAMLIVYADQLRAAGERPLATLNGFCERHLRGVFSAVHLLPFYPSSSDDGFSVMDHYAVDPEVGTWDDVERLGCNFELMFDGVFNHASVRGGWFEGFRSGDPLLQDWFVTVEGDPDLSGVVRPRVLPLLTEVETVGGRRRVWTTFSADQADLNFKNPRVLVAMLEVLMFYARRGARYVRLDAIAYLWKEIGTSCLHLRQTHLVIRVFRAVLDVVAPRALLVTETNVPHAENISYFGKHGEEAQLVYNFALPPLVLHSYVSGDAGALTGWARSLEPPPAGAAFLNFLASHDGIGVTPVRGILELGEVAALERCVRERGGQVSRKRQPDGSETAYELNINLLDALSLAGESEVPEVLVRRYLGAHSILMSLQGVPAVYFHSLVGSRGDREAVVRTGMARRVNRQKLELARLESELAEGASVRARVFRGMMAQLAVRRLCREMGLEGGQVVMDAGRRVFGVMRGGLKEGRVMCVHNVSGEAAAIPAPGEGGAWVWLCGDGGQVTLDGRVQLEPWGWLWARADGEVGG